MFPTFVTGCFLARSRGQCTKVIASSLRRTPVSCHHDEVTGNLVDTVEPESSGSNVSHPTDTDHHVSRAQIERVVNFEM
jgi:hypothetical protein